MSELTGLPSQPITGLLRLADREVATPNIL